MVHRSLAVLAFVLFGSAYGSSSSTVFAPHHSIVHQQLLVRGGAGPLNKNVVAKGAAVMMGAQGITGFLSPAWMLDQYKIPKNTVTEAVGKSFSTQILCNAVFYVNVAFNKGMSLEKVVGAQAIIWALEFLRCHLDDEATKVGYSKQVALICSLVCLGVIYSTLFAGGDLGTAAVKFWAIFCLANGALGSLSPKTSFDLWGMKGAGVGETYMMRALGYATLHGAVLVGLRAWNKMDALQTVGVGWAIGTAFILVTNFITNEVSDLKLDEIPQYIWMIAGAIVVGTLGLK